MNTFFDEVVEKARIVADAAGKKTGELVELSKYKIDSIRINNDIEKLYRQLGQAVYSMVKGGYDNHDLVEGLTEEIDELLLHLDIINEKLGEMKQLSYCPACGAKNSRENFYCTRCGSRLKNEFEDEFDDSDEKPEEEAAQAAVPPSQANEE